MRCVTPEPGQCPWSEGMSLSLSTCLPPSAFREVGQLTVCSCQDCIVRPPLRCSPPPSLPLFQRRVPLPLESWALRIQPFSSTSRCAIRIKRWLAPSAVCWIPQSGREWERRAFKSLRCRAGKAASQRKSDALLTLLIRSSYFPGEKKRDLQPRSCNEDWCPSQRTTVVFPL